MNCFQREDGGYCCPDTLEVEVRCEACARHLANGEFSDGVDPIHYDRDHATPGAHFRVFGCYDTAAYPNPYSYNWRSIAEFDALFAALNELASEEVAEQLGWRSPW